MFAHMRYPEYQKQEASIHLPHLHLSHLGLCPVIISLLHHYTPSPLLARKTYHQVQHPTFHTQHQQTCAPSTLPPSLPRNQTASTNTKRDENKTSLHVASQLSIQVENQRTRSLVYRLTSSSFSLLGRKVHPDVTPNPTRLPMAPKPTSKHTKSFPLPLQNQLRPGIL